MGVREVLGSCLGGMQRSKKMIWGVYASTKRFRTPGLQHQLSKTSID
jgi:hypothetical protein